MTRNGFDDDITRAKVNRTSPISNGNYIADGWKFKRLEGTSCNKNDPIAATIVISRSCLVMDQMPSK